MIQYVFCYCPIFVKERKNLEKSLRNALLFENLVGRACRKEWDVINSMIGIYPEQTANTA